MKNQAALTNIRGSDTSWIYKNTDNPIYMCGVDGCVCMGVYGCVYVYMYVHIHTYASMYIYMWGEGGRGINIICMGYIALNLSKLNLLASLPNNKIKKLIQLSNKI